MTRLVAQEIYLLEKFSSPEYLAELRDTYVGGSCAEYLNDYNPAPPATVLLRG